MKRPLLSLWITASAVGLFWFGCGKEQALSPETGQATLPSLAKPAAKAAHAAGVAPFWWSV